jgi:hypothetical protein
MAALGSGSSSGLIIIWPVCIRYEDTGSGFPLLLIAGGGLNSVIAGLATSPFDPVKKFRGEYRCIAADLRNAIPASLCRGHGSGHAGAECGSQHVSVEGAEGAHSACGASDTLVHAGAPAGYCVTDGIETKGWPPCRRDRRLVVNYSRRLIDLQARFHENNDVWIPSR